MNKLSVILLLFLAISTGSKAQNSLSSDELFSNARNAAFEDKNYEKAKKLAFEALEKSPRYADVDIFLGRIYSWGSSVRQRKNSFFKNAERQTQ